MNGEAPEFHLEQFLPYLVHRVGSRLAEGFEDRFAEAGLTLQQWRAAAVLYEFGPQAMGDIARRTSINASTMTRLIGQMEKQDLVKRERPVANQRTVYVRLLDEGRKRVESLIPQVIDYESDLSACFSEAELRTFKTLLEKFFHSLVDDDAPEKTPERLAG
ncbi:MAG: MarR family transcriptional regulator [Alphaproteobacteria bacterium]|nr:MarR family transcriptional regulator [Alphaproteobacteria bacterium]